MRHLKRATLLLVVAAIYVLGGKLGLRLGILNPSTSAVWAPTGIALAACIIFGPGMWPAILFGALYVNYSTTGVLASSIGVACGNTLEALVGAELVQRWAGGNRAFESGNGVFRYAVAAALIPTALSATFGVTSLTLAALAPSVDYRDIWLTWWLGDAAGALIVAPPLILWARNHAIRWPEPKRLEAAALGGTLVLVTLVAFGPLAPLMTDGNSLGYFVVPILVWAAVRFETRDAATAVAVVAAIAVYETVRVAAHAHSPLQNTTLVLLQTFLAVTALTVLILAATVAERRAAATQLEALAITDPLTGLANYRRLIAVIDGELERAKRAEREFAVILFDLDGLKKINDKHGHLVGSRALVRLADAIRQNCRAIDTPARLGGDEFALVLPETSQEQAQLVAERIRNRLAGDAEKPKATVSTGVSVFPVGGTTLEQLLGAADQALYGMKREG